MHMISTLHQSALCFASVKTQPTPRETSQFYLLQADTLEDTLQNTLAFHHNTEDTKCYAYDKGTNKPPSLSPPEVQREPNSFL